MLAAVLALLVAVLLEGRPRVVLPPVALVLLVRLQAGEAGPALQPMHLQAAALAQAPLKG